MFKSNESNWNGGPKTWGARGSASATIAAGLAFENISHDYEGVPSVRNLSLSIAPGEILCLLGHSGCGKTTLMRIAAGIERQSAGRVLINGKEISGPQTFVPPERRGIGLMFQDYALFPHMTVAENLAFPLEVRKMDKTLREEKIKRALGMVQMNDFAGRRPAQLSGGQQQRIALARALVFEPELVLMDEPLGALDKQLRETLQFEITNLAHELGITVVYVTHDQTEALTMSDRVAVFDDGRIQQLAPPDELY